MNKNFSLRYLPMNFGKYKFFAVNEKVANLMEDFPYKKDYIYSYPDHELKYSEWLKINHPDSYERKVRDDEEYIDVADEALMKDIQTLYKLSDASEDNPSIFDKIKKVLTSPQAKIFYGITGVVALAALGIYGKKKINEKNKVIEGLQNNISELKSKKSQISNEYMKLNKENQDLSESLTNLRRKEFDPATVHKVVDSLNNQMADYKIKFNKLKKDNEGYKDEVKRLIGKKEILVNNIGNLNSKLNQLNKKWFNKKKLIQDTKVELNNKKLELSNIEKSIDNYNKLIKDTNREMFDITNLINKASEKKQVMLDNLAV